MFCIRTGLLSRSDSLHQYWNCCPGAMVCIITGIPRQVWGSALVLAACTIVATLDRTCTCILGRCDNLHTFAGMPVLRGSLPVFVHGNKAGTLERGDTAHLLVLLWSLVRMILYCTQVPGDMQAPYPGKAVCSIASYYLLIIGSSVYDICLLLAFVYKNCKFNLSRWSSAAIEVSDMLYQLLASVIDSWWLIISRTACILGRSDRLLQKLAFITHPWHLKFLVFF